MSEAFLLGNGVLVAGFSPKCAVQPQVIPDGAVVWRGERILAVGPEAELRRAYPDARFLDAHGGLILPGLINLHHHFYAALARGLDPGAPLTNFAEILDRLWWRLDRALNVETVRISAQLSAADCIRWGCTTVFDHHASPSCLAGSLDVIADVVNASGLSAVLCYEVTDRNGHEQARAGMEENLRFIQEHASDPRIRGVVGLHASFTLRDTTLAEVAERRPPRAGCHIHVAEDLLDVEASRRAFGLGPVERLERFGLLDEHCLLAHGIHLQPDNYRSIASHDAVLVHNPESNANNGVGHLDAANAAKLGCTVGLGTDGMSSSMLRALRAAFFAHRACHAGEPAAALPALLFNNVRVARRFFDEPLLGELAPGAPADVIVLDSAPPTPITAENLLSHLVYGASEAPVRHTVARGRVLLENFCHTTLDVTEIAARARELTPGLWQHFAAMKSGTNYLGQ
ncbi:MAG: amidohydrolase family protein [Acidobacteria bacterium]|nr:amidohydrolase family protein [Acidobacteriota bacterium]MCL5286933.1 amidohydrolase family protein [Acidobacteriota bacterium]